MGAVAAMDELIDRIVGSGLLSAEVLARTDLDPSAPATVAARQLVRERLLTPFQARSLLAGEERSYFVTERFKVLEHLGRGGMGEVYMVEHLLLRRVVAMKLMTAQEPGSGGTGATERFFREARAVAALDHPNVVRVFDMDRTAFGPFLVMEYVDGSNLHAVVARGGPLTVGRAADAVRQAAAGLGHAHAAGLIHRDVKPGNLLLDRMGTVKVVDLGLARYRDAAQNAGLTGMYDSNRVIGTADFQAPEQGLDSGNADARSDVYGLGAAFYYMLTGRVPYPEGTITNKLLAHQMKPVPNPVEVNPDVPEDLAAVVMRMMAKRPADRPQSMADVRAVLGSWQPDELDPPPAAEMPKHPPTAYRLGLCPPPTVVPLGGWAGGESANDTPPLSRTAPISQRMAKPTPSTARGPSTMRMAKPAIATPVVVPEPDVELAPVELADSAPPKPERQVSRRGLFIGLGGGLAIAAAGGISWVMTQPPSTRPTGPAVLPPVGTGPGPKPPAGDPLFAGSGSSFVKAAMEAWADAYRESGGPLVGYNAVGSGLGVDNMLTGSFPFGCTESPVTDTQAEKRGKKLSDVLHIPLALGAVVPVYNLPGLKAGLKLRFTGDILAEVFAGVVRKWNDRLITKANPGVYLPNEDIVVVHRSDESGSTFVWTDYLCRISQNAFAPAVKGEQAATTIEWVDDKTKPKLYSAPGSKTTGAAKNDGVAKAVRDTPFALGYVEMGYALDKGVPFGKVKNDADRWVEASTSAVTAAAAGKLEKGKDGLPDDLRFSLVDAPGIDSYPISSAAWAVLFKQQSGDKGRELVKFLRWVIRDGQRMLPALQYASLPVELVKKIDAKLDTVTH